MNYWSILVAPCVCGCVCGVYFAYHYGKQYVVSKITEQVMSELDSVNQDESFKVVGKTAHVKFDHLGKTHSIFIPYDRKISTSMLRKKVYLIKGDHKIDISQKPGIPYTVCAKDLGGTSIVVENLNGEIIHTYPEDQIPRI